METNDTILQIEALLSSLKSAETVDIGIMVANILVGISAVIGLFISLRQTKLVRKQLDASTNQNAILAEQLKRDLAITNELHSAHIQWLITGDKHDGIAKISIKNCAPGMAINVNTYFFDKVRKLSHLSSESFFRENIISGLKGIVSWRASDPLNFISPYEELLLLEIKFKKAFAPSSIDYFYKNLEKMNIIVVFKDACNPRKVGSLHESIISRDENDIYGKAQPM